MDFLYAAKHKPSAILRAILIGIVAYGGLSYLTQVLHINDALGIDIRPGVIVPALVGLVYGPVAGFAVGFFGNALSDLLSWSPDYGTYQSLAWFSIFWNIGNGCFGLLPGLLHLTHPDYKRLRVIGLSTLMGLLGLLIGVSVAVGGVVISRLGTDRAVPTDVIWSTWSTTLLSDGLNMLVLLPLVLYNLTQLSLMRRSWWRSPLLARLLLTVILAAALPTFLLGLALLQTIGQNAGVRLLGIAFLTLLFSVSMAVLLAQTILGPLLRLTDAAKLIRLNQATDDLYSALKDATGNTELASLTREFGQMAEQQKSREKTLEKQVVQLRIEIDQTKKAAAVAEITESDYFQELRIKAKDLRKGGTISKNVGPTS